MSTEGLQPKTPEVINEQIRRSFEIPEGLSRSERRRLEKAQKKSGVLKSLPRFSSVHALENLDDLLLQEDIAICNQELGAYEYQRDTIKLSFETYRIQQMVGIPEAAIRVQYLKRVDGIYEQGNSEILWSLATRPKRIQQQSSRIADVQRRARRLIKKHGNMITDDEELDSLKKTLLSNQDLSIEDVYRELLRLENENIELIKLQIEFLTSKKDADESLQTEEEDRTPEESTEKIQQIAQVYSLADWAVYWTKRQWSSDANHLIPLATVSEPEAVKALSEISRGQISIRPASIMRALEFHLRKEIIQRALASRNKYGPAGIRDWVKIKRGRDRIFLLVPEEGKAIFFAAGRDVVYR